MASHTQEEIFAIQRCNAILLLTEALRATQSHPNAQARARAMVDYFASLKRGDKFDLISLLSLPPPVPPTRQLMAGHAHGKSEPAGL